MLFGVLDELIDALDPTTEDYENQTRRLAHEAKAKKLIKRHPVLLSMHSETEGNMKVTPLVAALMTNPHRCSRDIFHLLIKEPCNLNAAKSCGRTALHFLALYNHIDYLITLLSNDRQTINVNAVTTKENYTPVYMAALKGNNEAVTVLTLKGKADVNICNAFKQSPLHMACFFGQTKGGILNPNLTQALALKYLATIRLLLAAGAWVNAGDTLKKTPLYYLSEVVFPQHLEYIRERAFALLQEYGAISDMKSAEGFAPSTVAIHHGFKTFAAKLQQDRVPTLQQLCIKTLIKEDRDQQILVDELAEKANKLRLGGSSSN